MIFRRKPKEPWENGVDRFRNGRNVYRIVEQVNGLGEHRWVVQKKEFHESYGSLVWVNMKVFSFFADAQRYVKSITWSSV